MSEESDEKKRKFDSQEQEVYLSLWRTYDRLKGLEEELFQSWELTSQQYNVLRILQAAAPRPVPTLQLSTRLISRARTSPGCSIGLASEAWSAGCGAKRIAERFWSRSRHRDSNFWKNSRSLSSRCIFRR